MAAWAVVRTATEWAYLAIPVPYVVVLVAAVGVILGRPPAPEGSPSPG